ncbi:MAG TPA: hypothetical protein VGI82_13645 [Chitinophagaceae bacterium]
MTILSKIKGITAGVSFLLAFQISFTQDKYIDSLKAVLRNTTEPVERYHLLSGITNGFYRTGIGEDNVNDYLEMLRIASQLKNDSLIANSYNKIGDFYAFEKGDFNTALDYFFNGIPFAVKAKSQRWLSSFYLDISVVYYYLQNPVASIDFLKKAEANLPDAGHPEYKFLLLQLNFAYSVDYLFLHQPKNALSFLNVANETNMKLNFPVWDLYINAAFGNLYEQMDEKDLARVYFKKAVEGERNSHSPFGNLLFRSFYTVFLTDAGNYPESISQSKELLILGEQAQNDFVKFRAVGLLKNIFEKQRKYDSAYYYSKQELGLRDTLFNQERLNKIQAMAFNEELRTASEKNKRLETERERRQNIQYALIACGIIFFVIIFLLLSHSIIVTEKWISFFGVLGLLVVFEFINLVIHPTLAIVTHESPILMLVTLVVIASLLIPLHHRVEKWITEKMTEKNKKIRLDNARRTVKKLDANGNNT